MNIKELLEEQKEVYYKDFTDGLDSKNDYLDSQFERARPTTVFDWHKQSFLQFIDYLIERENKMIKNEDDIKKLENINLEEYKFTARIEVESYNEAKEETITHLLSIKKEIEI